MKKYKFKLQLIIVCCLFVSFAQLLVASESLSIYTPERFGFNGSLKIIKLQDVDEGPSDTHFKINFNSPNVYPVLRGHMNFTEETNFFPTLNGVYGQPYERDNQDLIKNSISTYGIARLTFDSYNDLHRIDNLNIEINPNDKMCRIGIRNAYYQRTGNNGNGKIEICNLKGKLNLLPVSKFFDVVSHETGHSILDALNGIFSNNSSSSPYASFHESFGDLSTFFASVRLAHILSSEQSLVDFFQNPNLDFCLARNFSGNGACLRSYEKLPISCESHEYSVGFTRFYITVMKESFDLLHEKNYENAIRISNFFQDLLIKSVTTLKSINNLYDMGEHIINQLKCSQIEGGWKQNFLKILSIELNKNKHLFEGCSTIQYPATFWKNM